MFSQPRNKTQQNPKDWDVTGTEKDKTQKRQFPANILTGLATHTGTEALLQMGVARYKLNNSYGRQLYVPCVRKTSKHRDIAVKISATSCQSIEEQEVR